MSGFPAEWLALREPVDARARDGALAQHLEAWAARRGPLAIVDLGSGTGANRRWLAPRLPAPQSWRLVEKDPALIAAGTALIEPGADCRYVEADLGTEIEAVLGPPVHLVTASALLDLCSLAWLRRLLTATLEAGAALLVALTYDGRVELDPPHPNDAEIIALVNRHQRQDKGLGPALGPDAVDSLAVLLEATAGERRASRSDWRLGPAEAALQMALIEGWALAALKTSPGERQKIEAWRADRLASARAGQSGALVGHQDFLYLPA